MKLKTLAEAFAKYGPGDPETSISAFRQAGLVRDPRRRQFNEPEMDDHDVEGEFERQQASAHRAKLSDEKYNKSQTTPPVTTYTAVAADEDTAKRRVNQLRYTAWRFDGATIRPLPDGRFSVKVEYVQ